MKVCSECNNYCDLSKKIIYHYKIKYTWLRWKTVENDDFLYIFCNFFDDFFYILYF